VEQRPRDHGFHEVIRLDPRISDAFAARAFIHANRKDYDRAIADYDAAIRLDHNNGAAFRNRGLVHKMKGDIARANADFEEARRLGR
jgi:Tfp pilus assembly protein PilF